MQITFTFFIMLAMPMDVYPKLVDKELCLN